MLTAAWPPRLRWDRRSRSTSSPRFLITRPPWATTVSITRVSNRSSTAASSVRSTLRDSRVNPEMSMNPTAADRVTPCLSSPATLGNNALPTSVARCRHAYTVVRSSTGSNSWVMATACAASWSGSCGSSMARPGANRAPSTSEMKPVWAAARRDNSWPSGRASSTKPSVSTMSPASSPRRIGQGGDVGADERPLLVADFGEPQCPPQPARFLDAHARLLGDLHPGEAPVPGQQPPSDHLCRRGLVILGFSRCPRKHVGGLFGCATPSRASNAASRLSLPNRASPRTGAVPTSRTRTTNRAGPRTGSITWSTSLLLG